MNICRIIITVLPVFFLASCGGASASRTYTPDGKNGYTINCSGLDKNWGLCYQKAGSLCQENGYDIVEVTGEAGTVTDVNSSAGLSTTKTTTTHNRIMLIQCKDKPPEKLVEKPSEILRK